MASVATLFVLTKCDDKPVTPTTTTPKDTTSQNTVINKFRAGFEVYNLDVIKDLTYGAYYVSDDETVIQISGISVKNSVQGAVDGPGDVILHFPGNKTGTFKQADGKDVDLQIGTGEGIKRNEYGTEAGSNVIITVTTYDAVNGRIKGTFSGTLKEGINSIVIDQGQFDVLRKPNI